MSDPPNVLLLVVDSLRYDAVTSESSDTPTFDWLGAEGVTFTDCYSQGVSTAPSMTAMLTGRYPLDYGGHWYLADDQPTLAEELRASGYATGAIHSNPNVSRLRNFDKGFGTFEENIVPWEPPGLVERLPDRLLRYGNKAARLARRTPYLPADRVNERMLEWLDDAGEPWFLWTQYMDPHGPYVPGGDASYREKFRAERLWRKAAVNAPGDVTDEEHAELRRNYRREVEYLDAAVGRFLDRLADAGQLSDTVVVLIADHGDEFREHGRYGHGNLPYRELVHVPLVVRLPDGLDLPAPDRVEETVRCVDLLPTLLSLAEIDPSETMAERMVGEPLLTRSGAADPTFEYVVTEKEVRGGDDLRFGLRDDRWTYLYDGTDDRELLFDRDADADEQTDVAADHPDVAETFRDRLADRLASIEATSEGVETPDVSESAAARERLEALGYRE